MNLLSNPFKSLQGPSHSVLPQGFRSRTKYSVPCVVLTCQAEKQLGKKLEITNQVCLYLLHCCQRVSVSKHDPQFILLFQRSLEKTEIHPHSGESTNP